MWTSQELTVAKRFLLDLAQQDIAAKSVDARKLKMTCAWLLQNDFVDEASSLLHSYRAVIDISNAAAADEVKDLIDSYNRIPHVPGEYFRLLFFQYFLV